MDAFYASVEQRDHPEWRGKPVIVGANSPRGVVSAASYEARRFGVHSAMPGFRARELCPDAIFVAGDMEKYSRVSREVHRVFSVFTDAIEPLALDEAFLDISGSVGLFGPPLEIGRRIKEAVRERTGLVVSVGIAPNKLVAKLACGLSKPDGLRLVEPQAIAAVLGPLPIRKLWGVGPKTEELLLRAGLDTLGQLAAAPHDLLVRVLGPRGPELALRAQGVDDRPVVTTQPPKSIGEEATFETDILDSERVSEALTAHAEAVARRARRAGLVGRTVVLKIKLGRPRGRHASRTGGPSEPDYPLLSRSHTLPAPTADGALIRRVALELWQRAQVREPVRLLGVTLSSLSPGTAAPAGAAPQQLELFGPPPQPAASAEPVQPSVRSGEALGRALDAIEDKFGRGAVRRAVHAPDKITQSDRRKVGEEPDDS
jgi:DNA polymerase-4